MNQKTPHPTSKHLLLFALLVSFFKVNGQTEEIEPLRCNPAIINFNQTNTPSPNLAKKKKSVLNLPFFDDFASTKIYPDKNRWVERSVFVNSSFPINPPSHGVATFDGLNKYGYPYNIDGNNVPKSCDTLTSQNINLQAYNESDSVYLSFYLQQKGVGDVPESNDSFIVEFKKDNNEWYRVWAKSADFDSFSNYPFNVYTLNVPAQNTGTYFHDSFQFRFRNYGNRTGALDHWHLDYVYLDENRFKGDTILEDICIYRQPKGLFNNYYSLPWRQYREDRSFFLNTDIDYNVYNKAQSVQSPDIRYSITDKTNDFDVYSSGELRQQITDIPSFGNKTAAQENKLLFSYFDTLSNKNVKLELLLIARSRNINNPIVSQNDTFVMHQYFDNFLAYDDGSAEGGYGLKNTRQGGVALRYTLASSDTLKYIAFNFTGGNEVLPTQMKFNIMVWERLFPEPVELAKISGVKPIYTGLNNGFAIYELEKPIPVSSEFFIGWEQYSAFNLNVGVDLDYRFFNDQKPNPNLYFNAAGAWENSKIIGTPLIRPVFGLDATLSTNDVWKESAVSIYPNPAKSSINIELNNNTRGIISIVNLQGKTVLNQNITSNQMQFDITALNSGLYFIRFESENGEQMVNRFVKE
ncbi:MAG: T9SS type A sorting domain-containing protein [Bacteroidia bacterium]